LKSLLLGSLKLLHREIEREVLDTWRYYEDKVISGWRNAFLGAKPRGLRTPPVAR